MRVFIIIVVIFYSLSCVGQDTFWQHMDMSGKESEVTHDMCIVNDTVYIWGNGRCDDTFCMHYYIFDSVGELLLFKEYPGIVAGWQVYLEDSVFYLPVRLLSDVTTDFDGFRLAKFSIDGEMLASQKYTLDDFENAPLFDSDYYYSYGCIGYGDKVVLYGEVVDVTADDEIWQTCMFWYNKDMSLDTIIFVDPKERVIDTWDAEIDQNGLLTLLIEYKIEEPGEIREDYLVYVKYNKSGDLVEFWDGPEWTGNYRNCPLAITDDNHHILYTNDTNASLEIQRVDSDGQVLWNEYLNPRSFSYDDRIVSDLMQAQDGHIVGCGVHYGGIAELYGGYLFKLDKNTGEMLWERTYIDWTEKFRGDIGSVVIGLRDVGEFSDGSLFLVGERKTREIINNEIVSHDDLFLIKLDKDGCLEPGCGGTKQHLIGEPAYDGLLTPESQWYFQDHSAESGIIRRSFFSFFENIYLQLTTQTELDPRHESRAEGETPEIYRTEEEGRKIYYTGEGVDQLLYDFTLDVGDIFDSEYIDQPLQVIESDTLRLSNRAKMRYWVLQCTENPENTITWLEKIGTYQGVLWPQNFCSGDYGDKTFTCFYRWERLAHMNPDVDGCLLPSSTDEEAFLALSAITAYPNPTDGKLSITSPSDLYIECTELMDTKGITHTRHHDKVTEVHYDLSGYPSGLYFVSVYTEKGSVVKKIVVEY